MFDSSLNSINKSFNSLEQRAQRISQAGGSRDLDLAKETVSGIQDKHSIVANIKVIQVQEDTEKSLLNILR